MLWWMGCNPLLGINVPEDRAADAGCVDGCELEDAAAVAPQRLPGRIQGLLRTVHGEPLGGVAVSLSERHTMSDSRGLFELDSVVEGQHQLVFTLAGFMSERAEVWVESAGTAHLAVVLPEAEVFDVVAGQQGLVAQDSRVRMTSTLLGLGVEAGTPLELRYILVEHAGESAALPPLLTEEGLSLELAVAFKAQLFRDGRPLSLPPDDAIEQMQVELTLLDERPDPTEADRGWVLEPGADAWLPVPRLTWTRNAGDLSTLHVAVGVGAWWGVGRIRVETGCVRGRLAGLQDSWSARVQSMDLQGLATTAIFSGMGGHFCVRAGVPGEQVSLFAAAGVASPTRWQQALQLNSRAGTCARPERCVDLGDWPGDMPYGHCPVAVEGAAPRTVMILSSSEGGYNEALRDAFEQQGFAVILGPHYASVSPDTRLHEVGLVYLGIETADSPRDMSEAGQRHLLNWIHCGGALLSAGWVSYVTGLGGLQQLGAALPTRPATSSLLGSDIVYMIDEPEPTLHRDLPEPLVIDLSAGEGSQETALVAKSAATTFYESAQAGAGLVGWQFNRGRVAVVSAILGPAELAHLDCRRLLGNLASWLLEPGGGNSEAATR